LGRRKLHPIVPEHEFGAFGYGVVGEELADPFDLFGMLLVLLGAQLAFQVEALAGLLVGLLFLGKLLLEFCAIWAG
jgi:hypothetical protein